MSHIDVPSPVLGVIGWSGSGKTTLLEFLVGRLAGEGVRVNVETGHSAIVERRRRTVTPLKRIWGQTDEGRPRG